jgi:hypothetical protein
VAKQLLHNLELSAYAPQRVEYVCRNVCHPNRFSIPNAMYVAGKVTGASVHEDTATQLLAAELSRLKRATFPWPPRNCGCRQRLGIRDRVYPAANYLEVQMSYETALKFLVPCPRTTELLSPERGRRLHS